MAEVKHAYNIAFDRKEDSVDVRMLVRAGPASMPINAYANRASLVGAVP